MSADSESSLVDQLSGVSVRLYIDEDSQSRSLVEGLRGQNIDVVTSTEAGMNGLTDDEQLAFAAQADRVLFTFNVGDFCRLHAEWMHAGRSHSGILTSDQLQYGIGERLKRLIAFVEQNDSDALKDRLEFLSNWMPVEP